MIRITDLKTEKHLQAINCLASPVTQQVILEMVQPIFDELEYAPDDHSISVTESYIAGNLYCNIFIKDDKFYNWLMDNPLTAIGSKIEASITKKMVFVSHNMCTISMNIYVSCDLPEEDFKTLDALGKVHREFRPGRMEESIYCEV